MIQAFFRNRIIMIIANFEEYISEERTAAVPLKAKKMFFNCAGFLLLWSFSEVHLVFNMPLRTLEQLRECNQMT